MTFTKTMCTVHQERWVEKKEKRELIQETTKEKGLMYKGLLHLIKRAPNSWVLSHELTGYLIRTLNYTDFACTKKATKLIYSLMDWNTTNVETLQERMREGDTHYYLREIVYGDEFTLETLRLKMLEKPKSSSDLINLMTA